MSHLEIGIDPEVELRFARSSPKVLFVQAELVVVEVETRSGSGVTTLSRIKAKQ